MVSGEPDREEIALGYSLLELFPPISESTVEIGHVPPDGLFDDGVFLSAAVMRCQTLTV